MPPVSIRTPAAPVHAVGRMLVRRSRRTVAARPTTDRRLAPMVIAADYPFLNVLWTMLIFFLWVVWIWVVITVLIDIFRRHDISAWAKAAWIVFVAVVPW